MFQQTFVEAERQSAKPYTMLVSLGFQIGTLVVLILIPLLYTQTLPSAQLKSMLMAPLPPAPVAPRPRETAKARQAVATRHTLYALVAPRVIPRQVASINDTPSAPDLGSLASGTDDGVTNNALLLGSAGSEVPKPAAIPEPPKPKPGKPLRVGGVVAEANIIHRVEPVYPPIARSARVQGTVEFSALISKEGRVENLQLLHGHPLLVNAAREAILQWRYRPTTLNGQPVEVLTSIVVNFKLGE